MTIFPKDIEIPSTKKVNETVASSDTDSTPYTMVYYLGTMAVAASNHNPVQVTTKKVKSKANPASREPKRLKFERPK